jgi:two-component system LytT family response regulator
MEGKIRSLIVEDEARSASALSSLIDQYCPNVNIIDYATSVQDAIEKTDSLKPDLVFLDIALPDGDGFHILENVSFTDFAVIFTTAFNHYATKAFEFAALHYLLKPINHLELQKAVKRFEDFSYKKGIGNKIKVLEESLQGKLDKIVLPSSEGLEVVNLDEVILFEASHNYTHCRLAGNKQILVSRPIINFENMLSEHYFVRIHSKYIINLKYLKKYKRGTGGFAIMQDNTEISVSKSRKSEFLEKLNEYTYRI